MDNLLVVQHTFPAMYITVSKFWSISYSINNKYSKYKYNSIVCRSEVYCENRIVRCNTVP